MQHAPNPLTSKATCADTSTRARGANSQQTASAALETAVVTDHQGLRLSGKISCFLMACLLAIAWASTVQIHAQDVYLNSANMQYAAPMTDNIQESAWLWSERAGLDVRYAGETVTGCVDKAITVRKGSPQEWSSAGLGIISPQAVSSRCGDGGFNIVINPYFTNPSLGLTMHELGHTLGFWAHSPEAYDIMSTPLSPPYVLTTNDVLNVLEHPNWPQYAAPAMCFAQLLPDLDIFHPDLNHRRGHLKYLGMIDGRYTWELKSMNKNPQSQNCNSTTLYSNGDIRLNDVRSRNERFAMELQYEGKNRWSAAAIKAI